MNETMGAIIARKRKELGLTQEQLAGTLGISYQAVSKWENELSSPDISTLPLLADLFGITIDELFGRERMQTPAEEDRALAPVPSESREGLELPWPDDDTLHAVLFQGHRLVGHENADGGFFSRPQISFRYEGTALNVRSDFDVNVEGDVRGSVSAEGDVNCEAVDGNVSAGGDVSCGSVGCDLRAGGDVSCDDVSGHVQAGGDVNCDNVDGNVSAGGDIKCADVEGSVTAAGDVSCGTVGGNARAEGDISCGYIAGSASAGGDVDGGKLFSDQKGRKKGFNFDFKF